MLLQLGQPGLFRVDLGTRQVSLWPGTERLQFPAPSWMGLDATDAHLVTRDVSTFGLYALDWEAP